MFFGRIGTIGVEVALKHHRVVAGHGIFVCLTLFIVFGLIVEIETYATDGQGNDECRYQGSVRLFLWCVVGRVIGGLIRCRTGRSGSGRWRWSG